MRHGQWYIFHWIICNCFRVLPWLGFTKDLPERKFIRIKLPTCWMTKPNGSIYKLWRGWWVFANENIPPRNPGRLWADTDVIVLYVNLPRLCHKGSRSNGRLSSSEESVIIWGTTLASVRGSSNNSNGWDSCSRTTVVQYFRLNPALANLISIELSKEKKTQTVQEIEEPIDFLDWGEESQWFDTSIPVYLRDQTCPHEQTCGVNLHVNVPLHQI